MIGGEDSAGQGDVLPHLLVARERHDGDRRQATSLHVNVVEAAVETLRVVSVAWRRPDGAGELREVVA